MYPFIHRASIFPLPRKLGNDMTLGGFQLNHTVLEARTAVQSGWAKQHRLPCWATWCGLPNLTVGQSHDAKDGHYRGLLYKVTILVRPLSRC